MLNIRLVSNTVSWKKYVEPVFLDALQKNRFFDVMEKAFPCVEILTAELSIAYNFVLLIMNWNLAERPSIQQVKCNIFLASVEYVKYDDMKLIVTNPFLKGWIADCA